MDDQSIINKTNLGNDYLDSFCIFKHYEFDKHLIRYAQGEFYSLDIG